MDENVKNNQISDEQLEKVSGGENTDIDELIKMINNESWSELEAKSAEREAQEMKAKGYVQRTCSICGMTFYGEPSNVAYVQYDESCCPRCRSIPII